MGQQQEKELGQVDVGAMWKRESKLSTEQRRKRYKCADRFSTVDKFPLWSQEVDNILKDVTPKKIEDARMAEKLRRQNIRLKEKEEKWAKEAEEEKLNSNNNDNNSNSSPKEAPKEKPTSSESESNETTKEDKKEETKEEKEEKEERERIEKEAFLKRLKLQRRARKRKEMDELIFEIQELETPLEKYNGDSEINNKITLVRADITTLEIDAVVNAANKSLLGGGGIDGAIHNAAGESLYLECTTLGGAETGETKITRGYNLPAKFVLHTVGPVGRLKDKLEDCYNSCLELVIKHKIKTVAFCGISTGIFGYPLGAATHVALNTIRKWLENKENRQRVDRIIMCTYLPKELLMYQKLMPLYFPPVGKKTEDVVQMYKSVLDSYDPKNDSVLDKEETEEQEKKEKAKKEKEARKKKFEEESQKKKEEEED